MGDEAKKIAQLGDVQKTVSIAVGHLEFGLDEALQLTLAYRALVALTGALVRVFCHIGSSIEDCPARNLKKSSKPGAGAPGRAEDAGPTHAEPHTCAFDSIFMRPRLCLVSEVILMAIQEYVKSIAATDLVTKEQVFRFLEMQFARADRNHDGLLDSDELAVFAQSISCPEIDQR
jgi:hypothetical protein